jgi:replication factor A1
MENIALQVKVIKLEKVREITTNYGFTHRIMDGEVMDETKTMELTVWNDRIESFKDIKPGDEITIDNCFITSYKGILSVNVGRESDTRIDI